MAHDRITLDLFCAIKGAILYIVHLAAPDAGDMMVMMAAGA